MRNSERDALGFAVAIIITTTPSVCLAWFGDNLSKDGPIGWPAYMMPTIVGVISGIFAGGIACVVCRLWHHRMWCYAVSAGWTLLVVLVIFLTTGLGDWCFGFAERFRPSQYRF